MDLEIGDVEVTTIGAFDFALSDGLLDGAEVWIIRLGGFAHLVVGRDGREWTIWNCNMVRPPARQSTLIQSSN